MDEKDLQILDVLQEDASLSVAKIAEKFQIGMGVGSQRAALKNGGTVESYSVINNYDIPLKIANIGAPQLLEWKMGLKRRRKL